VRRALALDVLWTVAVIAAVAWFLFACMGE